MNFTSRLAALFRRPPLEIARRIRAYFIRKFNAEKQQVRDRFFSTYPSLSSVPSGSIAVLMPQLVSKDLSQWHVTLRQSAEQILEHHFDLLGSGLVVPHYGFKAFGFEGRRYTSQVDKVVNAANSAIARRLHSYISAKYQDIDWQLDFRSGYRWSSHIPSARIQYGHCLGVDIKLPWELSRMQHLPLLALACLSSSNRGADGLVEEALTEFQNQFFDFQSANPPRFGVNWACTMDVAIRVSNLLIAYDLFRSNGFNFSLDFDKEFKRSIFAHGCHIVSNLEWFEDLRSNHYLANIAGLFFVAAYLPATAETDSWLALAANELSKEIFLQFQPDGSNFEGSTSYHRLSSEMVIWSVALAHKITARLDRLDWDKCLHRVRFYNRSSRIPKDHTVRAEHALTSQTMMTQIAAMGFFSAAITRPDGLVVQIGDNDSGRFIRLTPDAHSSTKAGSSHEALVESVDAMCHSGFKRPNSIDALLISKMLGSIQKPQSLELSHEPNAFLSFEQFGLYIMRTPRIWTSIRCGQVGQLGNGGHAHNDQLSLEICADGMPFIVDPGTYVYTPDPEQRNHFRSTRSHATLSAGTGEQNQWLPGSVGLFSLKSVANTKIIKANLHQFIGEHDGFQAPHRRSVEISYAEIAVTDECHADKRFLIFPLACGVSAIFSKNGVELSNGHVKCLLEFNINNVYIFDSFFSPEYGKKIANKYIEVRNIPEFFQWKFCIISSSCVKNND